MFYLSVRELQIDSTQCGRGLRGHLKIFFGCFERFGEDDNRKFVMFRRGVGNGFWVLSWGAENPRKPVMAGLDGMVCLCFCRWQTEVKGNDRKFVMVG